MAGRLFDAGADLDGVKCASGSCRALLDGKPSAYDERTELHFCDDWCFTDYLSDNLDEFAEWYAGISLRDLS